LIKNLEDAHQVVPPELIEVAKKNPRFRKRNNRWGNNRNNGRRNNYNNDRRKGDYNYSRNNANEIPLGGNNQYSSSSFSNYSRNNNNNNNNKSGMSKGYMSFTKAKSDIGRSTSSVDEKK